MTEAKAQFPKGVRVRLNAEGRRFILKRKYKNSEGVVVGYSDQGESLRVRWDAYKTVDSWAACFLERIVQELTA